MKTELTPGWNIFKQIFHDHWDEFKQFNPRYDHAYYDELVNKMLACGDPDRIGYLEHRCLDCGQGKHLVAMSCKSALCLRCAKVYVDEFVRHVSHNLHEGVIYRHTILTLPAMLWDTFYHHSSTLLSELMRCGVRCMDEFFSGSRTSWLRVNISDSF